MRLGCAFLSNYQLAEHWWNTTKVQQSPHYTSERDLGDLEDVDDDEENVEHVKDNDSLYSL